MASRNFAHPLRASISAFFFSLLLLASFVFVVADAHPRQDRAAGLTVHEWGTFTVVSGANGETTEWRPLNASDDLPGFVQTQTRNGKSEIFGSVRMETPVIYFYSDRETKVSVAVDFPAGRITEWYPDADVSYEGSTVAWNDVQVRPGATDAFPAAVEKSHYFAARETDAAPLLVTRIDAQTKTKQSQAEKMLFYRGVGSFGLPLVAAATAKAVTLRRVGDGPSHAIVVECRNGLVGFAEVELTAGSTTVARPVPAAGGLEALRAGLETRLESSGLYPREASAMLATWGETWVEDGLRVFFVVPRPMTDTLLPLRIQPAPSAVERVLLGRIEMVTPEFEASVVKMTTTLAGPLEGRPEVREKLRNLGHFTEPILRIVALRHAGGVVEKTLHDEFPEVFRNF